MEVSPHLKASFPPLGMMPSFNVIDRSSLATSLLGFKERYEMNEWAIMGRGDILLLHTDGLSDHRGQDQPYFPGRLEQTLRDVKHLGAREIYEAIKKDLLVFAQPADDISMVVIKLL
jgi:serine phosphatase RsbU (regulator of sigma subunit)